MFDISFSLGKMATQATRNLARSGLADAPVRDDPADPPTGRSVGGSQSPFTGWPAVSIPSQPRHAPRHVESNSPASRHPRTRASGSGRRIASSDCGRPQVWGRLPIRPDPAGPANPRPSVSDPDLTVMTHQRLTNKAACW
jgi:hypothetical protein